MKLEIVEEPAGIWSELEVPGWAVVTATDVKVTGVSYAEAQWFVNRSWRVDDDKLCIVTVDVAERMSVNQ